MRSAFLIGLFLLTGTPASAIDPDPVSGARLRQAIDKSLPLLLKGVEGHAAKRSCFACHNQAIPMLALTTAQATLVQALANYRIAIAQLERFLGRR